MSDPKTNPSLPSKPKEEMSTEFRLMLAFGLMAIVLMVTQYFTPKPPANKQGKKAQVTQKAPAPSPTQPGNTVASGAPAPGAPKGGVGAAAEQTTVIDTDLYRVTFTNRGGTVRSWILKQYKDSTGKPLDLVNPKAIAKLGGPFSIAGYDWKSLFPVNGALFAMKPTQDQLGVDFEYSGGGYYARKSFRFSKSRYIVEVQSELREGGALKQHFLYWRGGFGDGSVIGAASKQQAVFYDASQQKLLVKTANDAKDGPAINRGNYTFAGLADSYFAATAFPEASTDFRITAIADTVPSQLENKDEPHVGAFLGGEATNRFSLFLGPKDIDLMRTISPRLDTLVDWGMFGILAKPLFAVLHFVNDAWTHNWGWAIVLVTILINLATLPFKFTGLKSARKMQAIQPQLKALQDKYAGMSMKDPKRAKQNEEMMEIYKKNGVNPVSGCIPNLLIIPFFLAFYTALTTVIELRGAEWLWVTDLSRPETLAIRVLPLLMLGTQILSMRMIPTGGDPMQQKMMMLMMPAMLVIFMYSASSGLVLYWLTSNVVGIAQQWIFNRFSPAPAAPATPAKSKKK